MTDREVILQTVMTAVFTVLFILSVIQALADEKPPSPLFDKAGGRELDGGKLYAYYCTPCHGEKGDGNGFNAKNLDPRPAKHTDPNLMTRRTDEELFDAISGGGKRVGKSTLMPPWGNTFDKAQIKSLVQYLRKLCKCQVE
jgi:mono/diheme cytochrome c family protein